MTKEQFEEECRKLLAYDDKDLVWSDTGFVAYWTEKSLNGNKMRFEKEKVFDIKRRFATWKKHSEQWTKSVYKQPEPALINVPIKHVIEELPDFVKKEKSKEFAISRFEHYKKTGNIGFHAFSSYNTLCDILGVEIESKLHGKIKTLVPDNEVRTELFNKEKEKYINYINLCKSSPKVRNDNNRIAEFNDLIKHFAVQKTFEHNLKEAYLKHYFDQLITNNETLNL